MDQAAPTSALGLPLVGKRLISASGFGRTRGSIMMLKVHQVTKEEVFGDLVRVSYSHRPNTRAGQIIRVSANGRTVRAVARGAPSNNTSGIWLDDALRQRLGLQSRQAADFRFSRANLWDEFVWAWRASNPVTRVAARISLISGLLGLVSVFLGLLSLYLAMRDRAALEA